MVSGHTNQKMDMVACSIHAQGSASDLTNDTSEVGMEVLLELGFDEGASLFGAENKVHQ